MRRTAPLLFCLLTVIPGYALAESMQDQLAAVVQAENQGKAQEQSEQDAREAQYQQQQRIYEQRQAQASRERAKRLAAAQAIANQKAADSLADKNRDRAYQDQLRDLDLQQRKLQLEQETARVKRENDYIDQDLKKQAAQTEVIQSEADANRNLSQGGKNLLTSEGKAREEKADKWFN